MINARAQNAYGIAHFAQQNHVPQVRWENVDIIGDFIKNQMAKKRLEMMDKDYELAKDQAAFAREKFGYDQERDKVKDEQWDKKFAFDASEAEKNRQANIDLENVRGRNNLAAIAARENAILRAENRANQGNLDLFNADRKEASRKYHDYLTKAENYMAAGDSINAKKYSTKSNKLLDQSYRVFGDISKELPQEELIPYSTLYIANKVNLEESLNLK